MTTIFAMTLLHAVLLGPLSGCRNRIHTTFITEIVAVIAQVRVGLHMRSLEFQVQVFVALFPISPMGKTAASKKATM